MITNLWRRQPSSRLRSDALLNIFSATGLGTIAKEFFEPENDVVLSSTLQGIVGNFLLNQPSSYVVLESTLEGINGNILLFSETGFDRIQVTFSLAKETFDNIAVISEWQKELWYGFFGEFSLVHPGTYNFQNISVEFYVAIGSVFEDIPVIFSAVLQTSSFTTYVLQKLYCVTSEIGAANGDLELQNWNVKPNQTWFVHVNSLTVTLYETEVDMLAVLNAIAVGTADADSLETVLTYVDEYEGDFEFYYQDVAYHMSLSEVIAGDRYFKIKPLTDLAEIRHPIYNNSTIILMRGQAELNLHTYTILGRELLLGVHVPEMESGDVVDLTSTRRNVTSEKSQILGQTITGSISEDGTASLINSIKVANYTELYRQ
jgi:hypothetical protein